MLTKKQLKQLRADICLNSIYYDDYSNALYIKESTAMAFFDSYIEYIYDIARCDGYDDGSDIFTIIDNYDNINNLYNYYCDSCIDGYDPLTQDAFIASKAINNSDSVVIYAVYDDVFYPHVLVAYYYLSGLYMKASSIKKHKLYYSSRYDDYYFILNKTRYYLNNFIRCNYGRDQ